MKYSLIGALILVAVAAEIIWDDIDKMAFVYHMKRHGARSLVTAFVLDIFEDDAAMFTVETGALTPQGMRQRYLSGKHGKRRYQEKYQLLSKNYVPGEIYLQSTQSPRTIQSSYSELMGLYPPGDGVNEAVPQALQENLGFASPPFVVRDSTAL